MTTRQAGFKRGRLSIRQRNTSFRFGMAAQQTLNASPMQACRSSEVSDIAVELKKGIVNMAAIRAATFLELAHSMVLFRSLRLAKAHGEQEKKRPVQRSCRLPRTGDASGKCLLPA